MWLDRCRAFWIALARAAQIDERVTRSNTLVHVQQSGGSVRFTSALVLAAVLLQPNLAHAQTVRPSRGGRGGAPTQQASPQTSSLRGVEVSGEPIVVPTDDWVTYYEVIVTSLDPKSPAAIAGLQVGDKIAAVILGGDVRPGIGVPLDASSSAYPRTSEDAAAQFYRRAARCLADCLLTIEHATFSDPKCPALAETGGTLGVGKGLVLPCSVSMTDGLVFVGRGDGGIRNVAVGPLGTNFVRLYSSETAQYVFKDQKNGHLVPTERFQTGIRVAATWEPVLRQHSAPDDIQDEVAKIRQASPAPLPPPQATAAALGGQSAMVIENGTTYQLTVLLLAGPKSQRIQLAPGHSQTVSLAPGNYEVAASVSSSSVTPFYGKEVFNADTQYSERFYIVSR
jgi:hypothetical protein